MVIEKPCFDSGLGGTWASAPDLPPWADGRDMSLVRPADNLPEL